MHSAHVAKNDETILEVFKGLSIAEMMARELIAARMEGNEKKARAVMKGILVIHRG